MNTQSRSLNSTRNLFYGIISQAVTLILQFVSRTVFIYYLGSEYLGVNGLYGNILNVLSLAELGIDNVMLFSLYKPIADNDRAKIAELLNYYKKIYRKIAIAVLTVGLALVPFLKFVVKSDLDGTRLILYYLLFLLNSVVSYFVAYKSALIKADQNTYIINNTTTVFTIIRHFAQALFLIITKNYIVYLLIQVICTVLTNFTISKKANRLYPFINGKAPNRPSKIAGLSNDIKYAFLYKLSNILIGNTDNILISVIVGTVYVGYYSNYSMFIFNISVLINMLVTSVFSSFGNLYAAGEKEKMYRLFNSSVLFFQWLATACSLCFYTVFNDFITIWIGKEYVLSAPIVFVIVLNFYNETVLDPLWLYRECMGLFKEIRYIRIYTAVINLVLSVILGRLWGLFGILISTFIAKSLTFTWYEPYVILNKLGHSVKKYWFSQFIYVLLAALSFIITVLVCGFIGHSFGGIILKIVISFVISTTVFLLFNIKNPCLKIIKGYLPNIISKVKKG
ncbi:MAG: lipopolysaccharide biosynthesis protein [Acutalibacteraceae bacterium]